MLLLLFAGIKAYVFGADTHYTSHPSDYYNTRDNVYNSDLYGSFADLGFPFNFSSHSIYGDIGHGPARFEAGRRFLHNSKDRSFIYNGDPFDTRPLLPSIESRDPLRDDDLLQRRFTSHGLSNHWLSD